MSVRAAQDQTGGDTVLMVRLQEIRDSHLESVRTVAGRWEQGLRGLLGVAGVAGVLGAPLAVGTLTATTQLVVGVLLAFVLLTAAGGLTLVMSAAYGSVRIVKPPASMAMLETLRWSLAERGRAQLLWGRRLAVAALVVFAASIALAWVNPTDDSSHLRVETNDGVVYCGTVLNSADGIVAVRTQADGRVQVPTAELAAVDIVNDCRDEDGNR